MNPAGQVGGEPVPPGQEFTYSVRAQGRLISPRNSARSWCASADGGVVRLKDVARIELGAQAYTHGPIERQTGRDYCDVPIAGFERGGAAAAVKKLMAGMKATFPHDVDYVTSLDTTLAVTEGMKEIVETLVIAIVLVIIVVYIFLQGWRATLIPLLAVPVSLIGTFVFFPLFGFSVNTLSLFGLVLAIGLVVDDAIVVVEGSRAAHRRRIDAKGSGAQGDGGNLGAGRRHRAGVVGGVRADGIYSGDYRTAVSAIRGDDCDFGDFVGVQRADAEPGAGGAVAAAREESKGVIGRFFDWFNRMFERATNGYVWVSGALIRKSVIAIVLIVVFAAGRDFSRAGAVQLSAG